MSQSNLVLRKSTKIADRNHSIAEILTLIACAAVLDVFTFFIKTRNHSW